MTPPARPISPAQVLTTAVAAAQAVALLGYAISIAVVALTTGIEGPSEVSSPTGVAVEIVTFALFGLGMSFVAWGRWRRQGWATVPFAVAQLLALTVGIPLATGVSQGRPAGFVITGGALLGLVGLLMGGRDTAMDLRDEPSERVDHSH